MDEKAAKEKHSYGEILKSSALIGGASVFGILITIVRTKAIAVMLGPAGFGLLGIFSAVADLVRCVAEVGINNSGVRQISVAVGQSNTERIAVTVTVLRRVTLGLGVLGALFMICFSIPLSQLSFGSDERAGAVALLSLAVLFKVISEGQSALLQGMRRIADLARVSVLGGLFGTIISIPLVWYLGERGAAPSVVAIAGGSLIMSWWYARQVRLPRLSRASIRLREEISGLLTLGVAFMASALMVLGTAYAVRTMIVRLEGLEAAGLYQAAWAVGGLYIGVIMQSMGADFYPRLSAVAENHECVNRLVNEQTYASLLLAGPGLIATLAVAPMLLVLLYSNHFAPASELLRWICLGMGLRVISWPIGFIIIAKSARTFFILSELAWATVNLSLTWLALKHFGLNGAGMAFVASYVFHAIMIYALVRRLTGFRWSAANLKAGALYLGVIASIFAGYTFLSTPVAMTLAITATILSASYSFRSLAELFSLEEVPEPVKRLLAIFRLTKTTAR